MYFLQLFIMSYTTVKRRNVIVAVNGDCVYEGVVNFSEFESRFFIISTNIQHDFINQ